jgi:drug/metabolite transporter (DMT)-like permease
MTTSPIGSAPQTAMHGIAWMIAATILYAFTFLVIRELTQDFSVFEVSFMRGAMGMLVMLPWLAHVGLVALRTSRFRLYCIRAVVTYSGMVCWFYGLANVPLADATALLFTSPLFTVAFLAIALGERVSGRRLGAILVGFIGAMIIIRPGVIEVTLPVLALLFTTVAYGAANAITRGLTMSENANAVVFYQFALVLPISAGPAALDWITPGWTDLPLILVFGALSLVSMQCFTRALAAAPAAVVMPVFYLQLPVVAVLAFLFYGETPDIWVWIGGLVICGASYDIARRETRAAAADPARGRQ